MTILTKFCNFNNSLIVLSVFFMSYKITEEGNIATVFLNGEIDMDVTETAK